MRPSFHPVRCVPPRGFSMIEMMVAVTLLTFIIVGLTVMFNYTKQASRRGVNQVEIMDGARASMRLLAQAIQQVAPSQQISNVNLFIGQLPGGVTLATSNGYLKALYLQDVFLLSRVRDEWRTAKFAFDAGQAAEGVATLTIKTTKAPRWDLPFVGGFSNAYQTVTQDTNGYRRLLEGVVHLRVEPFDANGQLMQPTNGFSIVTSPPSPPPPYSGYYLFEEDTLPTTLDVELGVLESQTLAQLRVVAGDQFQNRTAFTNFLSAHAGQIHFFRQRVSIQAENRLVP